jgi:hypothetical protein
MRRLAITACVLAACLAAPLASRAATYTVAVCDPGAGNANNAMSFSANIADNIDSAQWCDGVAKSRGLQTWSTGGATPGAHAGAWWFYASAGTSITHLYYTGDFSAFNGWVSHWATNGSGTGDPDASGDCPTANQGCKKSDAGVGGGTSVSTAVSGGTTLGFGIWCDASSCAQNNSGSTFGPAGSANVYVADITVNDPGPPVLSASGNLWGLSPSATIAGGAAAWTLNFGASDPGGACQLQAVIENSAGAVVLSDPDYVAANYTEPAPCGASSRGATWQPNLSTLPTGTYYLHVQANDSAGMASDAVEQLNINNNAPVLQATKIKLTGIHGLSRRCRWRHHHRRCRWAALKHRRGPLKLSFAQRGRISGVARTSQGAPLAGSPIDVYAHSRGWSSRLVTTLLTNSAGQFSYRVLPGRPSRRLTLEFPGAGTILDSLAHVDVDVGGRAALKLKGGLVAGHRAVFAGRVMGGYIPHGGKLVQLRYRIPGVTSWAPFGSDIYTGRDGRWRARVRIGAGARGYTYQLDVLVPRQSDWPYRRAVSRQISAKVR